ncbi:MAG: O-antigen ligase family protein [Chloroflexi bacterium]|nr:O-antigen ligase family protein [Chloroflexota bacterium]MCC6891277.1 O-antigen ligase family protein [Anaerolineae bacterium]
MNMPSLRFILGIPLAIAAALLILWQPVPVLVVVATSVGLLVLGLIHPVALLLPLLILSPLRVLIATEAQFQLPIDIGQIGLISYLGVYVGTRISHSQRVIPSLSKLWHPFSASLLLFIVVTGLSGVVADSVAAWLLEWLKWIQIFLLVMVLVSSFTQVSWEWLVFGLVVAGVANALIGIYEFFGGSGALHLLINNRFFRAFGTFGQPNPFGGFMGLLLPITVMAALGYGVRWWQNKKLDLSVVLAIFYALSTVVLLMGMLMSWSRGAWLGLGAAFLVLGLAIPYSLKKGLIVFGVVGCFALVAWTSGLLPQSIVQRLETSTQEFFAFEDVRGVDITPDNYAVAERLAHWQAALNMFTTNPWLGVGFGNYANAYPQYNLMNWQEPLGHAHNYYLNLLAEVGIIGLLAYGKVWVTIFLRTWHIRLHPDALSRYVAIGLLGAWVYLAVHSFFDNLYVNNLFLHLGVMLSIVVVLSKEVYSSLRMNL